MGRPLHCTRDQRRRRECAGARTHGSAGAVAREPAVPQTRERAGIFPDFITHRVQRRGAPPLSYYDQLGAAGFRMAAASDLALRHGLGDLFLSAADRFQDVRSALNSLSDTLFFPYSREAVERLLRQVSDDFERRYGQ